MQSKLSNFKKPNIRKLKFILVASFLLYFFSSTFIYAYSNKTDTNYLIPLGRIVQIDAELEKVIVRNDVAGLPFSCGDSIVSINGVSINNSTDLSNFLITVNNSDKLSVEIMRGTNTLTVNSTKEDMVKLNMNHLVSGFATVTYIDPSNGNFGAVAHPISIGPARKLSIKNGNIHNTSDILVQKSIRGRVGFINGKRKDVIGKFNINSEFGIKGKMIGIDTSKLKSYEVANLDEVKTGKAQVVLQTSSSTCETYDIEIINIENQRSPQSKTFKIKITDKDLLVKTGGIVQGMSGTPIIQNNKIIGAISHAIENDPTTGYAVFIQWMLDN